MVSNGLRYGSFRFVPRQTLWFNALDIFLFYKKIAELQSKTKT